ncbi:PadR family transcriptional regulator [Robertkochia sediminum]|uniref:PadR family transcriptional regulator n=1 Tax=Robertkochia sediminum TaxID=2785326 RepID=UPI001932AE2D|nr:PadR family transcriptional regulator [Robertkochia sediminum]MBL7471772.1 helix-turn-helix transcriptional regulator [Robertkochia sediminum]
MDKWKLYKGSLDTIVLQLLGQNDRMYGYEITQKVKEVTEGELEIKEGALYPALHRLEAKGLLEVEVDHVGNRMRKYYKLTEQGLREKDNALQQLEDYLSTMKKLIDPNISFG